MNGLSMRYFLPAFLLPQLIGGRSFSGAAFSPSKFFSSQLAITIRHTGQYVPYYQCETGIVCVCEILLVYSAIYDP